jgi:hypothetical protein
MTPHDGKPRATDRGTVRIGGLEVELPDARVMRADLDFAIGEAERRLAQVLDERLDGARAMRDGARAEIEMLEAEGKRLGPALKVVG